MTHVLAVARDTLLGFFRQRLLWVLVLGALGSSLMFAYFVSWQEQMFERMNDVSVEEIEAHNKTQSGKIDKAQVEQGLEQMRTGEQALFFGVASFAGNAVSLLLFGTLVAGPLRRGELRGLFVRPLRRSHYLLGRFMGASAALAMYWVLMAGVIGVFALLQHTSLPPSAPFAALMYLFKGLMLGSIALALSLFVRPTVAIVIAFFASSDWVSSSSVLYYLLPGDDRLGMAMQILHGTNQSAGDIALAVTYALDVTLVALGVALLRLQRLDIS